MNKLLKAAIKHYEAQKSEAEATLDIYFNDSVGIGEHSNLLDEVKEWTTKLSEADENLRTLKKLCRNSHSRWQCEENEQNND
jgi:hypothetical protein|tara:strand:- start:128 stop:373 length:246 start_codon:yes stop_codon:yes gene_type:complete